MVTILSQNEFIQALQQMSGMSPAAAKELLPFYDEAARAANAVLPQQPKLGFFSSQQKKVAAFVSVCRQLDNQVEGGEITPDGTNVALMLLMVSDKNFYKAIKAFANYAHPFRNSAMTTGSDTADRWFQCTVDP